MYLTIVLRKEVPDIETANSLANLVRTRLEDHPEVNITASVSESLQPPEPPGP